MITTQQLNQLTDIHSKERWKRVGLYRWRVETNDIFGFDAVVIGPDDGQLCRVNYRSEPLAEREAIRFCHQWSRVNY